MTSQPTDRTPAQPERPVGALSAAGLLQRRDEFPAAVPPLMVLPPGAGRPEYVPCHHCGQPAIAQWQRYASDTERESYWATVEANIRAQPNLIDDQNASYTADRTQLVFKAVFGCEQHQVPDMVMIHAADCGGHQACQCEGTTTNG